MTVKSVMTKNPLSVSPETSVTDAKALMLKKDISKLPVLDKDGRLVGIITKNDLLKAGPSDATTLDMFEIGYLLSKLTVSKVMTKNVVSVTEDEVVEEAARIMVDNQIGCVPVMNGNLLIGIVTESDLFHMFIDMFGARYAGVRVTVLVTNRQGVLARMAQKIADAESNIISIVTRDAADGKKYVTIKATDITIDRMKAITDDCGV